MKKLSSLYLLFILPFFAAAQTAKLKIKVSNAKNQTLKVQLPVDGTWFPQSAENYTLHGDTLINLEVPVQGATWVRINGWFIIIEPGETNVSVDYPTADRMPNVDRNKDGIALFSQRNNEYYNIKAEKYYKKDSTVTGLLKLIEQDRVSELKPYKDLLNAKKISLNFYKEIDHYFNVQANIIEAAIPRSVFIGTEKTLNPELEHLWKSAFNKLSWKDIQNTFHPDFYYHANDYAFSYLKGYMTFKQGKKLEVKDESAYLTLKYESLSAAFTGKMREYLLASFLRIEMMQAKFQPALLELFTKFKSEYTGSSFIKYLQPSASEIESFLAKKSAEMTDKQMVISNYASIDSFDQLLDNFKNKNVFIDVWATWCGPCKEEFKYNKELEQFLDSNEVEMLFISTDEDAVDEQWKTMIKHYDLAGSHVRTNKKLLQDMLNKFWDGEGYAIPRYILVSNGKVVNSEMLRPSDKEELYGMVKRLLNK